jgi:predicted DNA-binding transcriptional regulator YafY
MGRVSEETLAVKYEKILAHLRATQPEPQTIREIAEAIGQPVDESGLRTLRNWLATLEQKGFIHQQERGKYVLLKAPGKIKAVQLEPEELMALLLAARSLTAQQDRANLTIEVAIVKLARALTDDAAGELMRLIEQEYASRYPKGLETEQDIFRTIMRAFLNRLPVVIEYVTFDKPTTLNIYWIEPVAISRAIYLIGHSSLQNGLRTYRLDRVQSAKIVPNAEPYLPPQEYRSPEFLR